ncbi:MAG: hypothetical protein EA352_00370 [Gemmatimonadales bacterium]|nr:MAG: hypothetical protein EA352_00370 [Gemmatimonadales bacterium]
MGRQAEMAAAGLCWGQWIALGAGAAGTGAKRARSIVDPEALVLLSLYVSQEERRLRDMVAWWARVGSTLTSLQRMKTVAKAFPEEITAASLPLFATLATEAGDRRWRKAARGPVPPWVRPGKGPDALDLIDPGALWPRLRAGFGVGAKADLLAFLLGLKGGWASTSVIAYATGYSKVSIRNAASEMTLARLIRETEGRPSEYLAPPAPWAALLDLEGGKPPRSLQTSVPEWRFWVEVFAFLANAMALSRLSTSGAVPSMRLLASRARDLMEDHSTAFRLNNIPVPVPGAFKGPSAMEGLVETVRVVTSWSEEYL